jgi:hypothetical protein
MLKFSVFRKACAIPLFAGGGPVTTIMRVAAIAPFHREPCRPARRRSQWNARHRIRNGTEAFPTVGKADV